MNSSAVLNLKFLNELAASNDRNFKFTALGGGRDGCALRQTPPEGGVFPGNLVEHDHQVVLRNAGLGSDALIQFVQERQSGFS